MSFSRTHVATTSSVRQQSRLRCGWRTLRGLVTVRYTSRVVQPHAPLVLSKQQLSLSTRRLHLIRYARKDLWGKRSPLILREVRRTVAQLPDRALLGPLLIESSTHKTVKAEFWPCIEPCFGQTSFKYCKLFPWNCR